MDNDFLLEELVWRLIDMSDGNPVTYIAGFCPPITDDDSIIDVCGHRIGLIGSYDLDTFARAVALNDAERIEQIRQIAKTGTHVAVLVKGNGCSGIYTSVSGVAYVPPLPR